MAILSHPWGMYSLHQQQLARRSTIDDHAWGLEASLNALCADIAAITNIDDLRRATATASRRERYRNSILRRRASEVVGSSDWVVQTNPDGRCQAEARSDLMGLSRSLSTPELSLLVSIGEGADPKELATSLSITPEALRTRLSRARRLASKAQDS